MKKDKLENKNIFEDLNKIFEKLSSLEADMLIVLSKIQILEMNKYVVVEKTTPQPYFPNLPYMPNGPICEIKGDTLIGPDSLAPNNGGPTIC